MTIPSDADLLEIKKRTYGQLRTLGYDAIADIYASQMPTALNSEGRRADEQQRIADRLNDNIVAMQFAAKVIWFGGLALCFLALIGGA